MKRDEVFEFFRRLAEENPSPTTELESGNPYQLLVAVVLSAQATDASVNIACRPLFERITKPQQMVDFGENALRDAIKTIGLFNTKAKNVIALSQALIERHGGAVPRTREELKALPGVGRKTANVVLNTAFGEETFAVDTHVFRVCNRTGLAPGKTVDEVETKLEKIVPQPFRRDAHHWLILHGRYTCRARLPECWRCPVVDLCRYKPKTPPPEERVKPTAARSASRGSSKARIAKGRTALKRTANRNRSRPNRLP
ncbi:endonuclease III [Sphingomonas segetis]|uniref:endonuclease III n=1 Tax=Sphingomonas segetis TaxID=1104779 RepID=UPI0012D31674|nr:endonuclease III [Sphingomonas segetis]